MYILGGVFVYCTIVRIILAFFQGAAMYNDEYDKLIESIKDEINT